MQVLTPLFPAVVLVVATSVAFAAPVQSPSVHDLLIQIAKDKDGVDPKVFDQLAIHGNLESFRAFQRGLGFLENELALVPAYKALRHYAGRDEDAEKEVLAFLETEANKAKVEALRPVAVETLLHFREKAIRPLERIVRRQKDPNLRQIACDSLVVSFGRAEGTEGLELVLQNASLRLDLNVTYLGVTAKEGLRLAKMTHRDVIREVLVARTGAEDRSLMAKHMLDTETSRLWKLLLIDVLGKSQDNDTTELLAKLLRDDDAAVVLLVLEILMGRDDWRNAYAKLSPLLKNQDRSVRRAAVMSMGKLLITEKKWRDDALDLASHRDPALRMGAAFALAEIRTPEAIEKLYTLLEDRDWSVRAEALQRVTELRRKDSIPLLIERLGRETGRLRPDVYVALRMLTGFDHGRLPNRWRKWWKNEGAAFKMPTYAAAVVAEDKRRNAGTVGGTKSDHFYGVQVQSERVVFVLDISGSMNLPVGANGEDISTARPGAPLRIDRAKKELSKTLRALPDGTLFNIIFFESEVSAFSKKLVRMSKGMRQKSLRFVSDQFALRATALYPALKLAFDDPLVDTIYLLSDGAPTVGEITDISEVREEVKRWNSARHVRIHGVAVGQDSTLLQWLTKDTGGRYLRVD